MADAIYDYQFRIVVIGDATVGKTSIVRWFGQRKQVDEKTKYRPTIEPHYIQKTIDVGPGSGRVRLQIWDTGGQERYRAITKSYYKNSIGVVIVFDLTQRETFDHLETWIEECNIHTLPHKSVCALVGTKVDLVEDKDHKALTREARGLAAKHRMEYYETSAATGQNIDDCFKSLGRKIYSKLMNGEIKPEYGWDAIKDSYAAEGKPRTSASNRGHATAQAKKMFCRTQ